MVSVGTITEPAMELLQQHKADLEAKLGQVKQDVSAVLDQVEKEQVEKSKVSERLLEQKETNKSLVGELSQAKSDLKNAREDVDSLQQRLELSLDEVRQLKEAMDADQAQYRDDINHAEKMNCELREQVEQVTRAAEELQEHYNHNDGLARNVEIQE